MSLNPSFFTTKDTVVMSPFPLPKNKLEALSQVSAKLGMEYAAKFCRLRYVFGTPLHMG